MRKMKSVIAVILAAMMVFTLTISALAAGSGNFGDVGFDPGGGSTPTPPPTTTPRPTPGGGGGGTTTRYYDIEVEDSEDGTADSSRDTAPSGATIIITVDPNSGYEVETVTVTRDDGSTTVVRVTDLGDGRYSFTMPASDVTVTVNYVVGTSPEATGVADWLITDEHIQYLFGFPGNTFGPEENMTRAQAAQMFYNLLKDKDVPITVTFSDVEDGAWFATPVNTLASLGMVEGMGDGTFAPNDPITRAQFIAMAMNFASATVDAENPFSDVKAGDWFYDAVVSAAAYGWANGYPDGTFRPGNTITRVEVTAIVNQMLGRSADESFVEENQDSLNAFSDVAPTYWGYNHIVEATNAHSFNELEDGEEWTGLL